MPDGLDRRRFLKVLGVGGAGTAALAGCSSDQVEKLIPYLIPPTDQIPGLATYYASTCRECPAGCGTHVRVREGRAVKIEGNPGHPVNQGRLCARGQAALQGLYNPDRVRSPMARDGDGQLSPIAWDEAIDRLTERLGQVSGGALWFVTGNESGSFARLVSDWMSGLRSTQHVVFEPFGYEALRQANRDVFGIDAIPQYDFAAAHTVMSFGTDFLETWLSPVEHARGFSEGHAFHDGRMGRYVHVEPRMSMTAMSADEWIAPVPGTEALLALAMAHVIVRDGLAVAPRDIRRLSGLLDAHAPDSVAQRTGVAVGTIDRIAGEFAAESSVAVAGGMGGQHAEAHATAVAVNLLNYVAGNIGRTISFGRALNATGGSTYGAARRLADAMRAGEVEVLLVHGANPAYATPPGLGFEQAMGNVGLKVSFSRFLDETAMQADLILPDHDPLEQWNDYEPRASVYSLMQPVMRPVFDTRQTGDVLLQIAQRLGGRVGSRFTVETYRDYLQQQWQALQRRLGDRRPFDMFWSEVLQQGGVSDDGGAERQVRLAPTVGATRDVPTWSPADGQLTLIAYPSSALYDGRGANRPWLQELPDPVTTITWSTWVEIHPETAAELGIAEGDHVEVTSPVGSVTVPAYVYAGLRRDVVAMPLGQGHTAFGRYAEGRGANPLTLLSSEPTAFGGLAHYTSVTLRKTGQHERLPKTEGSKRQMGRGIAQAATLEELTHPGESHEEHAAHAAPVPQHIEDVLHEWQEAQYRETERGNYALPYTGTVDGERPRWAMAIDLSKCTGCGACVTACHAENNIPTVGPDLVRRGREMSWLRIERYFEGGRGDEPLEARFLPMMCQHCGNAPCEPVCPVFAAYHTADGLNAQVYNRCVGTRYCSNNCPYKVRYFNWFDFQEEADAAFAFPDPLHWQLNPDVTVRSKGVMEKCTFCVQRIRDAQNQAKLSGTTIGDGDLMTACQQTCPADAIVFGDVKNPDAQVRGLAEDDRGYHVLEDLNVRPAVTYLKKVRNAAEA
jgi:molybdopterin-containing oxidoreductase family iron-sulfur binding subunit